MSGSANPLDAIVDRMMEQLQKENPHIDYKRKQKPKEEECEKPKRKSSRRSPSSLH